MIDSVEPLVEEIERSFQEVERQLSDPDLFNDQKRAVEVTREHKRLKDAHELADRWRTLQAELVEAAELLGDDEVEIRDMAKAQREAAEEELPALEEQLRLSMIEPDPNDHRNVILEIRAGAGGDEAALWVGDLVNMYMKYATSAKLKVEVIELSDGDMGGYREAFFSVSGEGAYSILKWESGVHRVQRVPQTETQGRIHTSTASVVVRPEMDDIDLHIDMNDIRVDRYRSGGPGGQSVNTTDSAVRLTHIPTGIVASCQNEKSQIQNKEAAMRVLRARIYEAQVAERDAELGEQRRSAIGTGDRAEKIRTYNYAESRVTDHRIGLTLYQLDKILQGGLEPLIDGLRAEELRARLADRFGGDGHVA
ncbi:MAG: Peptide chain release factor 1 [Thermoleophilia bacterium]|nr:Peptide chain release factor 1 [Thermoleophilia bacterium]